MSIYFCKYNKAFFYGNYIIMDSNSANIFKEMLEEYEYNQRIEVLRKNRKQKLEKLKEIRNNL